MATVAPPPAPQSLLDALSKAYQTGIGQLNLTQAQALKDSANSAAARGGDATNTDELVRKQYAQGASGLASNLQNALAGYDVNAAQGAQSEQYYQQNLAQQADIQNKLQQDYINGIKPGIGQNILSGFGQIAPTLLLANALKGGGGGGGGGLFSSLFNWGGKGGPATTGADAANSGPLSLFNPGNSSSLGGSSLAPASASLGGNPLALGDSASIFGASSSPSLAGTSVGTSLPGGGLGTLGGNPLSLYGGGGTAEGAASLPTSLGSSGAGAGSGVAGGANLLGPAAIAAALGFNWANNPNGFLGFDPAKDNPDVVAKDSALDKNFTSAYDTGINKLLTDSGKTPWSNNVPAGFSGRSSTFNNMGSIKDYALSQLAPPTLGQRGQMNPGIPSDALSKALDPGSYVDQSVGNGAWSKQELLGSAGGDTDPTLGNYFRKRYGTGFGSTRGGNG
jgi:hypothetical protein